MVERFRGSGMTQRAFCQAEGIPISTLSWWVRKGREITKHRDRMEFREVRMAPALSPDWGMEMVSPRGWTIRCRQPLGSEDIGRLLKSYGRTKNPIIIRADLELLTSKVNILAFRRNRPLSLPLLNLLRLSPSSAVSGYPRPQTTSSANFAGGNTEAFPSSWRIPLQACLGLETSAA